MREPALGEHSLLLLLTGCFRHRAGGGLALALAIVALIGAWSFALPKAATAQARWPDERQAGPFICHADFSLAGLEPLLQETALLQQELAQILMIQPSREPIHLYLFANRQTHETYLHRYFPNAPYRRALFIKGRGPGMVFVHVNEEFAVDLRHEGTHALLHAALPMVPLWLDEGLAEYFEAPRDERVYHHPHLRKVRWEARLGLLSPLEDLEQVARLDEMGRAEYRHAWAWVHFMLHGSPEARAELVSFLSAIAAHTPPGKLSQRLRRRIPDLDRRCAEHLRGWKQ